MVLLSEIQTWSLDRKISARRIFKIQSSILLTRRGAPNIKVQPHVSYVITFHLLTKPKHLTNSKSAIIDSTIWSVNYRMFPNDGH